MTGFIVFLLSFFGGTEGQTDIRHSILIISEDADAAHESPPAEGAHTGHLLFSDIVQVDGSTDSASPFYPYPQVPLGWRRAILEWDDGWWYLDFADRR